MLERVVDEFVNPNVIPPMRDKRRVEVKARRPQRVTLPAEVIDKLEQLAEHYAGSFGFKPTLAQVITKLVIEA